MKIKNIKNKKGKNKANLNLLEPKYIILRKTRFPSKLRILQNDKNDIFSNKKVTNLKTLRPFYKNT